MKYCARVDGVEPGSIAEELGIEQGDIICRINDTDIIDFLDYQFLSTEEEIVLLVEKASGEQIEFEIVNEAGEDLGIRFANMLFDSPKRCRNQCIFCFIDQLPRGMRDSLYFKDDDSRLSFLYGNYVTFTNMREEDINRLIRYRISPINVSIHTTNLDLREKMLHNKNARNVLQYCRMLKENHIRMNMQIVLCKGINDSFELEKTLFDLSEFVPELESVSVVPVGLTAYRYGLFPLEPFTAQDAEKVLNQIEAWQKKYKKLYGTRLVYASDEFYILAGRSIPPAEEYEDFPQIENGVGMLSNLEDEVMQALEKTYQPGEVKKTVIATGELAYPYIRELVDRVAAYYPVWAEVVMIKNNFFGGGVSVAGLLCGQDLINQLSGKQFERLLITKSMLKADEDIFLDDITVEELEQKLGVTCEAVANDGISFVKALINA